MDKLLEPIKWLGAAQVSNEKKLLFVEYAVLCGFQAAQRTAGVDPKSGSFVIDVGIGLKHRGTHATGAIGGWYIRRRDGTSEFLKHKPVLRKRRPLVQVAKAGL